MASVLGAFLLIMVVGGFIAYWGDHLGYLMGKRRVTLFGLRPRHTATALTVVSGVVIGGLALAFLLIVNQSFRVALLTGENERRLNAHLIRTNKHLQAQADANRIAANQDLATAILAKAQAVNALAVLVNTEQSLKIEQKKTLTTQQQLAAKQSELAKLTASLAGERHQLAIAQADVSVAQADAKFGIYKALGNLIARREGTMIYHNYGELGRIVISASESRNQIRGELVSFLNRLSQIASSKGAQSGSNGRSVIVASVRIQDNSSEDAGNFVPEGGVLDALASSIRSYGQGQVVVIASAFGNSFAGNQVIILLRPFANLLAIHAGTDMGDTVITAGNLSVDDIVAQLQRFLVTQVRPAAIRAGVIPARDPQTGSSQLGNITVQQIYDLVNQIKQVDGPAVVTASTATDVYSADQLKLQFSVRPETVVGN